MAKDWVKTRLFKKWSSNVEKTRKLKRDKKDIEGSKGIKDLCHNGDFCKGSKDIPRRLMPQIYDVSAFAKLIKNKYSVKSNKALIAASKLKPSQNEINEDRVLSVIKDIKSGNNGGLLVVSKDGFIVDGHHRWAAYKKLSPDKKLPVLVIDLPIQDALGLATAVSSDREKF